MFGAAAMSLSSFCVVSNALRLNLFKLRDNRHDHKRTNHLNNEIKEEQAMEKTLEIKGMMCPHCEATVRTALEALPQVQEAQVSHQTGTAVVTLTGPVEDGLVPACRALVAPVELTTGKKAYFVGKPNPLMMRTGLRILGVHSEDAVMIGDRMDTDMVAGIETGLDTVLVLSGVTRREDIAKFPYRPRLVLDGVGDIPGPAAE